MTGQPSRIARLGGVAEASHRRSDNAAFTPRVRHPVQCIVDVSEVAPRLLDGERQGYIFHDPTGGND